MVRTTLSWCIALFCGLSATANADMFLGPTPYLSFAGDSSFASTEAAGEFSYFYLEDFEDLAVTPGLSLPPGNFALTSTNTFVDSVAEDYAPDNQRGSFYVDENAFNTAQPFTFTFDSGVLSSLPTHVGIVATDIQVIDGSFGGITSGLAVTVEAFGPGGVSLGTVTDPSFGNLNTVQDFNEDRFFGFIADGGIESISVSALIPQGSYLTMELDHVQYGSVVPEPSSLALLGIGAFGMLFYGWRLSRKKRHSA